MDESTRGLHDHASQNHRLVETGRGLRGSYSSTLSLKQRHQKLVAQDDVQMAFEYLQG